MDSTAPQTPQSNNSIPPNTPPTEKKSKLTTYLLIGMGLIILIVIGEVIYLLVNGFGQDQTNQQNTQNDLPSVSQNESSINPEQPKEPISIPEFIEERTSDANAIADAVAQYRADNQGSLPEGVTSEPLEISSTGANICTALIPNYMSAIPIDPATNNKITEVTDCNVDYQTGYAIATAGETITITLSTPSADNIEVSR